MTARRNRLAAVFAAIAATWIFGAPPALATDKPFSVVMAPSQIAGGGPATITATYTNLTSQQRLGSADLYAPAGLSVVSASISGFSFSPAPANAGATVDGSTIKLRSLSVPPDGSVSVSIVVRAGCAAGAFTWDTIAKQANDFSGPPGNDLNLKASLSSLTTTVSGGCRLSFKTQPQDVEVGEVITGTDGDPSGPPVAVEVLDSQNNPTDAAIPITINLGASPAGATLNGTRTVTSVGGVATFSTLSVTEAGAYTLVATSPGVTSATSAVFTAYDALVPCINNVFCTATTSVSGTVPGSNRHYTTSVTVDAAPNPDPSVADDGGALALSFNAGVRPVCPSYNAVSPDHVQLLGPNREKVATLTIAKAVLDARHRSPTSLQTCLIAPYQFNLGLASGNGGLATSIGDVDGDGQADFIGIVPSCHPVRPDPPCQRSAGADAKGNGVVVVILPADPRDPYIRH